MSKNQKISILRRPNIHTFSVVVGSKIQKVCISDLIVCAIDAIMGVLTMFFEIVMFKPVTGPNFRQKY